jgi:hypothetical protein
MALVDGLNRPYFNASLQLLICDCCFPPSIRMDFYKQKSNEANNSIPIPLSNQYPHSSSYFFIDSICSLIEADGGGEGGHIPSFGFLLSIYHTIFLSWLHFLVFIIPFLPILCSIPTISPLLFHCAFTSTGLYLSHSPQLVCISPPLIDGASWNQGLENGDKQSSLGRWWGKQWGKPYRGLLWVIEKKENLYQAVGKACNYPWSSKGQ